MKHHVKLLYSMDGAVCMRGESVWRRSGTPWDFCAYVLPTAAGLRGCFSVMGTACARSPHNFPFSQIAVRQE